MRTAAALPARAPRSAWPTAARTSRFRRSAAAGASARDAQPLGRQGTEKRRTHRRGERQRLRRWRLRRWRHIGDLRSRFKRRESSQVLRRNVLKLKPGASGGLHGAPPQRRPGPARESCAETRSSAGENKLPGRRVGLASQAGPTHRPRSIDDSCPLLQRSYVVDTHRGGQCKHTSAQKAWWERAWSRRGAKHSRGAAWTPAGCACSSSASRPGAATAPPRWPRRLAAEPPPRA